MALGLPRVQGSQGGYQGSRKSRVAIYCEDAASFAIHGSTVTVITSATRGYELSAGCGFCRPVRGVGRHRAPLLALSSNRAGLLGGATLLGLFIRRRRSPCSRGIEAHGSTGQGAARKLAALLAPFGVTRHRKVPCDNRMQGHARGRIYSVGQGEFGFGCTSAPVVSGVAIRHRSTVSPQVFPLPAAKRIRISTGSALHRNIASARKC